MLLPEDQSTLNALEWSLIQEKLTEYAKSPIGQRKCATHAPLQSTSEADHIRSVISECYPLLRESHMHKHLLDVEDPTEYFDRSTKNGVLRPHEIWTCSHFMEALSAIREETLAHTEIEISVLKEQFKRAPQAPPLCKTIRESVSANGEVLDSASKALSRLRQQLFHHKQRLETTLKNRIQDWYDGGLLQDKFYDVFDGRYVVPVKVESQSKIGGILLGRSRTEQSVFIEPTELNHANNAIKELEMSIHQEEQRILRSLTQGLSSFADQYQYWVEPLATLDLCFSAAMLAKLCDLHEYKPNSNFHIGHLFHPALTLQKLNHEQTSVIKNTVEFAAGGAGILVSGPNTGGKTVLLKAVGLAACMAKAGLFIAGAKNATIPYYKKIVAFIGDDQNIAKGLSSFSAQILDLKKILDESPEHSPMLILIDEILSSTDPEEASALAFATIDDLIARGHHVLVTTHFSELALRAKTHPQVKLAAMEFHHGKPTYHLRSDELGSSHALEVAASLGFPDSVLQKARSFISTSKQDYEAAKHELKLKEQKLHQEVSHTKEALLEERRKLEIEFNKKQKQLEAQLEDFLASAQTKVEETIHQLTQRVKNYQKIGATSGMPKNIGEKLHQLASSTLSTLSDSTEKLKGKKPSSTTKPKLDHIKPKDYVWVRSLNRSQGQVIDIQGTGANAEVTLQVGNFRVTKPLSDLELIAGKKQKAPSVNFAPETNTAASLDLRGKRFEQAMSEAERYLDQAYRSGANRVTIITGHGTGALKAGLKSLLEGLPYVTHFVRAHEVDDGALEIDLESI